MIIKAVIQVAFDPVKEFAEIERFRELHGEFSETQSTDQDSFTHTLFDIYPITQTNTEFELRFNDAIERLKERLKI